MRHRRGNARIGTPPPRGARGANSAAGQPLLRQALTLYRAGRPAEAGALFRQVLERDPGNADALHMLGVMACQAGDPGQGSALIGRAIEASPGMVAAHNSLGIALQQLGRIDEALASYDSAIRLRPDYAFAHYNRGNALFERRRFEDALASFDLAIRYKPDYADAHYNRGRTLQELGRLDEALSAYDRVIGLRPENAFVHYNRGNALYDLMRYDDALECYRHAVSLKPDYAEAHNNVGYVLKDQGRLEEASAAFERALQLSPRYAEAHYNLSLCRKFAPGDPRIARLEELYAREDTEGEDRVKLGFALGKARADAGAPDEAFRFFAEANRLRKAMLRYDISSDRGEFEDIVAAFSSAADVAALSPADTHAGPTPVFIVGMPRSGTTLVEQILASHSRVHGGGELPLLSQAVAREDWRHVSLSRDALMRIRAFYLRRIGRIGADRPFVTDKMPNNFRWIGFIRLALPEAKIVHVVRDPVAVCWSSFRTFFPSRGMAWSFDLEDVARYYGLYEGMMRFWAEKFPDGIHRIGYERLTESQEDETRRLLGFLGLPWEDAVMAFHRTGRTVRSASTTQVRQEMYRGSSEEWKKYESHLRPLIEALPH